MPSHKKNGVPDRWTEYQAVGKRLPGTRFIAFKVPLNKNLRKQLPPPDAFGPEDLVNLLEQERDALGLVIDLTFTTRYYKPQDLPEGVRYQKIFTAGHHIPDDDTILSFKRAVHRFLRENQDNDKLIGVHCTHGLNRTGYLVCRYLIDVEGMDPAEAIELFNRSRGHCIERENYLEDLRSGPKRSNQAIDQPDPERVRARGGGRRGHSQFTSHTQAPFNTRQPFPPTDFPGPYMPPYQMGLPPPVQGSLRPRLHPPPLPPYRTGPPRPANQGPGWSRPSLPWPAPYPPPPRYAFGEPWQPTDGPAFPAGPHGNQQRPKRTPRHRVRRQDRS